MAADREVRMPNVGSARGIGLVGREEELAAVLRQLEALERAPGIVTITGLPGVGKSTLARVAAEEQAATGTRTVVVPLRAVEDATAAADAVLAELPGDRLSTSLPEALWEAYDGVPVLLVLEDVDRVEGLAELVAALRDGYPGVRVLCTGLRAQHASGESVVRVNPLPLPAEDALRDDPALGVFAEHAARTGHVLDLDDAAVRADVARICREMGGLPGAIAVAAARIGTLGLAAVAHALAGRASLDAALGWSYGLLSKGAQEALVQLSVFVGPFQLDAVAAVVDRGPTSGDPADDLLELVDAHLVDLDPGHDGEARFALPTPVRHFARHLLNASEHAAGARDRHASYFHSRGRAGGDVVRREWPDIAAALDHGLDTGRLDDVLAAAVALAPDVQEVPGALASLEERIADLLERQEHVPDLLKAQALMWSTSTFPDAAADMQRVGLWTAQRLAEAMELARRSGDGPALLAVLERTIRSLRITLDLASAIGAAHEGLELATRLDDQRALSRFETYVGMAARANGDAEAAVRLATSAVVRGREHGDPISTTAGVELLLNLPEELRPVLDPPLPTLEGLLTECERLDQPFTAMTVLGSLAHESHVRGDDPEAARWLWRLLMIGANRQRTEPMATLGAVALLMSSALALGEEDDAARLREFTRPLETFLPYCVGPKAFPGYQRDAARLDASVPAARRVELAAEVAAAGMGGANHWAQATARRLAGHRPSARPATHDVAGDLTPRELDVVRLLASGRTNREIAEDLGMSAKTVMHHSVSIYRKLGVRGRTGATAWAVQHGLTRPGR
jgi:DNA-binding CsgD family transcriptional regulator/predicted ATPase